MSMEVVGEGGWWTSKKPRESVNDSRLGKHPCRINIIVIYKIPIAADGPLGDVGGSTLPSERVLKDLCAFSMIPSRREKTSC